MKITFILPGYCLRPVGGAKVVYQYANQLVKRGHEVNIVHPRFMCNRQSGAIRWLLAQGARLGKYLSGGKITWQFIDPRVHMLHVPEPSAKYIPDGEVVFATAWHTAEYVAQYPESKGRKFYLIQHYEAQDGNEERVNHTWKLPFKKVVIAKWLYKKGLALGVADSEMFYIPNGIDINAFRLFKPIEQRLPCLCMMYYRIPWKGGRDGVDALKIVHESYPDIRVLVFGRDQKPCFLPSWVKYWRFPSQGQLIEEIYNQSSIYICSSWTEGAPAPPAEAMACGCALVSTNCTGIDEYAEDGVNALLSPIKNPALLAKNLIKLLEDDDLRVRLAKAGHEKIQTFIWEHSTDLLEKCIKE
ncbi:MAG: glycosyltransferase family 4 protein [Candidatus Margulisiibacteriota bacterium]|jgi:glycosyltransferase involved in cell wall biosynthesis